MGGIHARAGVNGGLSMFPESTNSRSGKILTVRVPAVTATNQLQIGVTYSNYKDFNGVKFPTTIVQTQGGFSAWELTINKVVLQLP
jgi:hypothetical protein